MTFSEQYGWAEPLRREIPRVIANDLGEQLGSSRVAARPTKTEEFNADFKVTLDFQQLDAVIGKGADVDVLWRIELRSGNAFVDRSSFRQPLTGTQTDTPARSECTPSGSSRRLDARPIPASKTIEREWWMRI